MKNVFSEGVSRRTILQGITAMGLAASLTGCSSSDDEVVYVADEGGDNGTNQEEKIFSSICRSNCNIQCRLNVYTRNGRIVRTGKSTFVPEGGVEYDLDGYPKPARLTSSQIENAYKAYERICLRGLSNVQRYYSPTRILHPMQQKGKRGDMSTFERISWPDAIKLITDKIVELYEPGDTGALGKKIFTMAMTGNYGTLNSTGGLGFLSSLLDTTSSSIGVDMSASIGFGRVMGTTALGFVCGNELRDIKNAKNVFLWGTNLAETQQMSWKFLCDGRKENGGNIENIVSIEVMLTSTSSKSDYLYCVRPGSDAMLALAMLNTVLFEKKIHQDATNKAYLLRNTDAAFLVTRNTALPGTVYKYLKEKDLTGDSTKTEYVVYDGANYAFTTRNPLTTKTVMPAGDYAVTGEYDVTLHDGTVVKARPVYQCVMDSVEGYTPEAAAEYTGIAAADTRKLVELYLDGPSTIYTGFGIAHHYNSANFGQALAVLAAITGNVAKEGASMGNFVCSWPQGMKGSFQNVPARSGKNRPVFLTDVAKKIHDGSNDIKLFMICRGNPISNSMDVKNVLIDGIFNKNTASPVDLIVTNDMEWTDTARYSDLVLPTAHWFEAEEIHQSSKAPFVSYQEKVADPMGEALSDMDFSRLIVEVLKEKIPTLKAKIEALYYKADGSMKSDWDFITDRLDTGANPAQTRVSSTNLKIQKTVRVMDPDKIHVDLADPLPQMPGDVLAATGSRRLELFCENPLIPVMAVFPYTADYASFYQSMDISKEQLPSWIQPDESWSGPGADAELLKKYPFAFMNEHTRWRVHTQWTNVPWLRELDPEPVLKINPDDAELYGINTGDMVKVYNERGHGVMRAIITPATQKGVLNAPKGWQRYLYSQKYGDGGSYNDVSNPKLHPINCDMLIFDARVAIERLG